MNFHALLSPETRARLDNHKRDVEQFSALSDTDLATKAEIYLSHCERPRFEKGSAVYDSVMYYVIIPELIKRLNVKAGLYEDEPALEPPNPTEVGD